MAPAEPSGRNGDLDADRESPLGRRDHLARMPGISCSSFVLATVACSLAPVQRLGRARGCRYVQAMCGRVRLSSVVSEIRLVFSIPPDRPTPNIAPSWNVAPTDPLPVVRYDTKAGERSLDVMRWGLVPFWRKH